METAPPPVTTFWQKLAEQSLNGSLTRQILAESGLALNSGINLLEFAAGLTKDRGQIATGRKSVIVRRALFLRNHLHRDAVNARRSLHLE